MAKLPDADVILSGLVLSIVERLNFESKELIGYRATVVTATGGAAIVNFDLSAPLPFAPLMSQCVWRVVSAPWEMDGGNSGMSTKFVGVVDESHLLGLQTVLRDLAERFPEKVHTKN